MSSKASTAAGSSVSPPPGRGLGDVGGQQRLLAGAVEVGGVGRGARVADGEGEAAERGLQLAGDDGGAAADGLGAVGGDEQDDHAGRGAEAGGRGRRAARPGAVARVARSATARTRPRQSISVTAKWCARTTITAPPPARSRPSSAGAGEDVAAVGDRALEQRAQEGLLGDLGLALGRAQALDLGRDQRQHHRHEGRGRRAGALAHRAAGRRRRRRRAARGSRRPAASAISERSSAVERAATASTALVWSSRTSDASSARLGGADDLGQAGARRRRRP